MNESSQKLKNRLSSSSHIVNADYFMSISDKLKYFLFNLVNNLNTTIRMQHTRVANFNPSKSAIIEHLNTTSEPTSPSRVMSNIFWEQLDWRLIRAKLSGEIRVLEVGCGTGRYGEKLNQLASINSYKGVDIEAREGWELNQPDHFSFQRASFEDFSSVTSRQNLIITQSALEHFDQDLQFFGSIGNYAKTCNFPLVSIHLFPSPICLFTFLFHGIRQYNRKSILKLIRSSGMQQIVNLYILGGPRSNLFHFIQITLRSVIFRRPLSSKSMSSYVSKMSRVLVRDSKSRSKFSPSFYALILAWNIEDKEINWVGGSKSNR
jgi:SAM-dependent methyltransferase